MISQGNSYRSLCAAFVTLGFVNDQSEAQLAASVDEINSLLLHPVVLDEDNPDARASATIVTGPCEVNAGCIQYGSLDVAETNAKLRSLRIVPREPGAVVTW